MRSAFSKYFMCIFGEILLAEMNHCWASRFLCQLDEVCEPCRSGLLCAGSWRDNPVWHSCPLSLSSLPVLSPCPPSLSPLHSAHLPPGWVSGLATVLTGEPAACDSVLHLSFSPESGVPHTHDLISLLEALLVSHSCVPFGGAIFRLLKVQNWQMPFGRRQPLSLHVSVSVIWLPQTVSDPKRCLGGVLTWLCWVFWWEF